MKNSILLLFALGLSFSLFGQNNRNGISYQALITSPVNENGITISLPGVDKKIISYRDRDVCLRFSFLDSNGNTEYVETQQTTTDNYGMVNLVIGTGTPDAGYSWDNIAWTTESKSLKVDVDYGRGKTVNCDNFVGLSVQELTAVPFALYAPSVEGAPGPEGPEGPKGDKGDQGPQGPKGDKGDTGDQGPQGIQGPAGADGATGPAGPAGPQGADSTVPGPAGPQGATGPQGPKGDKGDTGDQGPQGIQGPAGATGPQGPQGATGADSTVPGPAGPQGATGPQGPKGDKGDTGDQGPQGIQGPAGATGPTGPQGATGADSTVPGPAGPQGATGPQGLQGIQGVQGETGPAGPQGDTGDQGSQGETGPAGPQGNDGADGNGIVSATNNGDGTFTLLFDNGTTFTTDDLTGPQGAAGATGSAGAQGIQGPQGATGPAGPTGPAGADGADGADGAQGIQGIQGPQGATGGDGPQGIAGNDGADGNGIVSATNNGDGTFTLTFDDGTTFTTDDLTGPQGATGPAGSPNSTTYSVGDLAQGGIVFWVDETGQHGLVVAVEDAAGSTAVDWNAGDSTVTVGGPHTTLATGNGIYAGKMNTAIIIAAHAAVAYDGNNFAAKACNEYSYIQNGVEYADWYLPSKDELHLIKTSGVVVPSLYSYNYWSSTELGQHSAYVEVLGNYANNYNSHKQKNTTEEVKVRAIRSFYSGIQGDQGPQGTQGPAGATGGEGPQGIAGNDGADGDSAYDIWLSLGNTGTQQDFIDSLTGPQGPQGEAGESSSSIGSVPLLTSNEIDNLNPSFGDMVFDTESLTLKIFLQTPVTSVIPQKIDINSSNDYNINLSGDDKYYYSGQITNDCYIMWAGKWGGSVGKIYKDTDDNLGNGKGNEVPLGTKFFAGEYVHFEHFSGSTRFWRREDFPSPTTNDFADGQYVNLTLNPKKFWKARQDAGYSEDQWYVDADWWQLYVDFKVDEQVWKTIIDYD